MELPWKAFKLFFRSKKLMALGIFPGAFTFLISSAITYVLWHSALPAVSPWITIPVLMLSFLASWILFGNLSLILVEDAIIDEVQRICFGEVRLPSPPFGLRRLWNEIVFSFFVLLAAIILMLLTLVPGLAIVNFLFAGWLTSYSYLSALYSRKSPDLLDRLGLFFRDWMRNILLGCFLNVLLFVPFLNVMLLGYAEVLATLSFFRKELNTSRT